MTTEPNAFAVRLAGGIPKLRLEGDIGDPVAMLVIGHIAADGLRATATGTTRTVGVKLEEAVPLSGEHADEIRKAVNRATRQREDEAKGLEVVPELAPGTVDGDAKSIDDAVSAFLSADDAELVDDPLLDPNADIAGNRDAVIAKVDELVASATPTGELERAWAEVDEREPGYADRDVAGRRRAILRDGVRSNPCVLRPFLLIERVELDDGSAPAQQLRHDLEHAIKVGEERYREDEPWVGYTKSTVKVIVGHVDGTAKVPGEPRSYRDADIARGNWPGVVEHVIAFERAHKRRATIVNAALDAAAATGVIIPGEDGA